MLIKGMTMQEMANYLVSLSPEQLTKMSENYSGFQVPLSDMDKLSPEDSTYLSMIRSAVIMPYSSDEELREMAMEECNESERCVLLAEMRKRHLI